MRIGNPEFVLGASVAAKLEHALRREGADNRVLEALLKPGCIARVRDVLEGRATVRLVHCVLDGRTTPQGIPDGFTFDKNETIGELRVARHNDRLLVVDESGVKPEQEIVLVPYAGVNTKIPVGGRHLPIALMKNLLESQYLIPGLWHEAGKRIRFLGTTFRDRSCAVVAGRVAFMHHNASCWMPEYEELHYSAEKAPLYVESDVAAVLVPYQD